MALPVLSADGVTTGITVIPGTRYVVEFGGTFGAGTVTLERLMPDGTNWAAFQDGSGVDRSFTSDGGFEFVTASTSVRTRITGSTTPSVTTSVVQTAT